MRLCPRASAARRAATCRPSAPALAPALASALAPALALAPAPAHALAHALALTPALALAQKTPLTLTLTPTNPQAFRVPFDGFAHLATIELVVDAVTATKDYSDFGSNPNPITLTL